MQELLALYSSGAMIAAAPDGAPPQRIDLLKIQKIPCPLCLAEALKRESFVEGRFSWFGCERIGVCPFLQIHSIVCLLPVLITRLLPPGNYESKELRVIIHYNSSTELSDTLNNLFVVRN